MSTDRRERPTALSVLLSERCDIIEDAVQAVRARMADIRAHIDDPRSTWPESLHQPWPAPYQFAWQASHTRGVGHEESWKSLECLELPLSVIQAESFPEEERASEAALLWWKPVREEARSLLAMTGPDAGAIKSPPDWLNRFDMAYGESIVAEQHMERLHGFKSRLQSLVPLALPIRFAEPVRSAIRRAVRLYLLGLDVECIGFCRVALESLMRQKIAERVPASQLSENQDLETLVDICVSPKVLPHVNGRQADSIRKHANDLRRRGNDVLHATLGTAGQEQALLSLGGISRLAFHLYPPPEPHFFRRMSDEDPDKILDDLLNSLGEGPDFAQ